MSNIGRKLSEETKEKLKNKRYFISVKCPDGSVYESIRECSEKTGIPQTTLKNWIHNKPEKDIVLFLLLNQIEVDQL